jgi:hypothetical protein
MLQSGKQLSVSGVSCGVCALAVTQFKDMDEDGDGTVSLEE